MVLNRKRIAILAVAAVAGLSILGGIYMLGKARGFQLFGALVDRVDTGQPLVALTFDDGPTLKYTNPVLAILRDRQVPATFFLTGQEIEENTAQARAIVADGHEIGNHSYSHANMMLALPSTVKNEIERTDAAIRAAGYQGEILFRPPFGKKFVTLPWHLSEHGRTTVMWDIEPESYPDIAEDPEAMTQHILDKARNGSIILLHLMYKSREASREALPRIIDGLRARGFRLVTVSELIRSAGH